MDHCFLSRFRVKHLVADRAVWPFRVEIFLDESRTLMIKQMRQRLRLGLINRSIERTELVGLYKLADICWVGSPPDGINWSQKNMLPANPTVTEYWR